MKKLIYFLFIIIISVPLIAACNAGSATIIPEDASSVVSTEATTLPEDASSVVSTEATTLPEETTASEEETTVSPTETEEVSAKEAIRNGLYQGIYEEPVQLVDGYYEGEPFEEGAASRPTVTFLGDDATGDLNGDGAADAVAIVYESSGGSGTFAYLAAFLDQEGSPVNIGTEFLADRIDLETMTIEAGEIVVTFTSKFNPDPITKRYQVEYGALIEQAKE